MYRDEEIVSTPKALSRAGHDGGVCRNRPKSHRNELPLPECDAIPVGRSGRCLLRPGDAVGRRHDIWGLITDCDEVAGTERQVAPVVIDACAILIPSVDVMTLADPSDTAAKTPFPYLTVPQKPLSPVRPTQVVPSTLVITAYVVLE